MIRNEKDVRSPYFYHHISSSEDYDKILIPLKNNCIFVDEKGIESGYDPFDYRAYNFPYEKYNIPEEGEDYLSHDEMTIFQIISQINKQQ